MVGVTELRSLVKGGQDSLKLIKGADKHFFAKSIVAKVF